VEKDEWTTQGQTEIPSSMVTSRPPFDPTNYAAEVLGEDRLLRDDVVLHCVPNVSWSEARVDFDELSVLQSVDGVASVLMLESFLDMPREQLRSILFLLLSRGVLAVCAPIVRELPASLETIGNSGFFARSSEEREADATKKLGTAR
jgi:hypothetical protein